MNNEKNIYIYIYIYIGHAANPTTISSPPPAPPLLPPPLRRRRRCRRLSRSVARRAGGRLPRFHGQDEADVRLRDARVGDALGGQAEHLAGWEAAAASWRAKRS